MLGTQEIILLALVAIVLFGSSKIPELARSLGKATGEFKKAKLETEHEISDIDKHVRYPKIKQMASELGIAVEGKNDEQLLNEIQQKMPRVG